MLSLSRRRCLTPTTISAGRNFTSPAAAARAVCQFGPRLAVCQSAQVGPAVTHACKSDVALWPVHKASFPVKTGPMSDSHHHLGGEKFYKSSRGGAGGVAVRPAAGGVSVRASLGRAFARSHHHVGREKFYKSSRGGAGGVSVRTPIG
jgi:hypothetical protein